MHLPYLINIQPMKIVISNMIGEETTYMVADATELIIELENKIGVDFNTIDLFSDDSRLTKSLKFMEAELYDGIQLYIILSDKPVRVMDKNVDKLWNALTLFQQDYVSGSIWDGCSTKLEEMFGVVEERDVSFITTMSFWFAGDISGFNRDITKWDVSSVRNFGSMFSCSNKFNQDIRKWDVSSSTDFSEMFIEAQVFDKNLSEWNVQKDAEVNDMFNRCYRCHAYEDEIIASWECLPFEKDEDNMNLFYDSDKDEF